MKIDIKHFTEEVSTFEFVLTQDQLKGVDEGFSFSSEGMKCEATVKHIHQKFVLKGKYRVALNCACVSCLDKFQQTHVGNLDLILSQKDVRKSDTDASEESDDGSFELHLGDQDEDSFSGNELDLALYFENQFFLDLPIRLLCSENCKGICSNCGNNLNKVECSCEQDYSSSPFAALKDLKFD